VDDKIQAENAYNLKSEIEQWKTRYNYVLSENAVLIRQKNDSEVEVSILNIN